MATMDSTAPKQSTVAASANPPPQPDLDLTGQTLGDFRILRRLGQGGMGQVYLAEQLSLKRKVALKLLKPEMAANPTALARFRAEAEAVARITHANIVQVYHIGESNNLQYMALEYVEGRNLREFLERKGTPDVLLALSIMRQVAAALQRASEMGIIHRDIKPENILLTRKGEVKVADFGLSRVRAGDQPPVNLTQSGVTMGTPLYMSPEQVEGKPVDCRTDVYSFGVTAYHMLAGHPPFKGSTAFEVALSHVQKEPPPLAGIRPDLPPGLCAIIHKMLAKDPNQRYQNGRELLRDLILLRESLSGQTMALVLPTDSMAVTGSQSGSGSRQTSVQSEDALTAERTSTPRSQPVLRPAGRSWTAVLVVLSLALAVGAGIAWGWWRQQATVGTTAPVNLAETAAVDALFSPQRREQALRQMVEQYLNPPVGQQDVSTRLGVCLELGLFYLDQDRLDDAEKLFSQLKEIKHVRPYQNLGKVGLGIVLALRSQPKESNALFRDAFASIKVALDAKPTKGPVVEMQQLQQNGRLRYWLAEAFAYNKKNGVVDGNILPLLPPLLKQPLRQWLTQ